MDESCITDEPALSDLQNDAKLTKRH